MIPPRIIAFGSSSVKGRGDPEGGGFVGRLDKWHKTLNATNVTVNLGVVGDSTAKMLGRFGTEVPSQRPDLIILYPGLNDSRRKSLSTTPAVSDEEFRENLNVLIKHSLDLAPTIFVSAFPVDETRTSPWAESKQYYLFADAARFTEIGRQVCETARVTYLPIFETWSNRPDLRELSIDGLHGTPKAHQLLADKIKDLICDTFA